MLDKDAPGITSAWGVMSLLICHAVFSNQVFAQNSSGEVGRGTPPELLVSEESLEARSQAYAALPQGGATSLRSRAVSINTGALRKDGIGSEINITLFDGPPYTVKIERVTETHPGYWLWAGKVIGETPGVAKLVLDEAHKTLEGSIRFPDAHFVISSTEKGFHVIYQVHRAAIPDDARIRKPQ